MRFWQEWGRFLHVGFQEAKLWIAAIRGLNGVVSAGDPMAVDHADQIDRSILQEAVVPLSKTSFAPAHDRRWVESGHTIKRPGAPLI